MSEVVDPISAVFRRTNADGSYYYSDADVKHYLPLFIVLTSVSPELLSPESLALFARFVAAMRSADPKAEVSVAAVLAYYEKHPVNAELAREMKQAIAQLKIEAQEDAQGNFGRLLATAQTAFVPREPPKTGQVRAGPLARFTVDKKKP